MRFSSLNPQMTGTGGGLNELVFDCPKCGAIHRVILRCRMGGPPQAPGIWAWRCGDDYWNSFTLEPSVQDPVTGRDRVTKQVKTCGAHFSVRDGEVVLNG